MGKAFEFADFVDEFAVVFTVLDEPKGHYNGIGKWVSGGDPIPRQMDGIILPLTNDDLKFENNGAYSSLDRKIYVKEPLQKGQKIEYKGQSYTIHESKPYEDYADVYIYFAKGVGSV